MNDPWEDVAAAGEWLLKLEDEFRSDVVHLNGCCHGALPWRAPKIVVGHSCVLSSWRATKGCEASAEWNRYRKAVIEGLALAEWVVAPSNATLSASTQRVELSANARRAASRFTPEKMAEGYLAACARVTRQPAYAQPREKISPLKQADGSAFHSKGASCA